MSRSLPAAFALAACVAATAVPAEAQYFGRNKVRYRGFSFQVMKTEHFDLHYYPEERAAAEHVARMAERWYARLSRVLHHELSTRQPVILYASHPDFEQTNAIEGELGEGTGGVTEILKRRIVLPLAGPLAETDHVLGHELVHAFQFDMTGYGGPITEGNIPAAVRMPLWFIEGMAEYLSLGPVDPNTAMWMRDAVRMAQESRRYHLPSIRDLDNPRYFPYRWGQAFWAYVAGRWGDRVVGRLMRDAIHSNNVESLLSEELGIGVTALAGDWHAALEDAYLPLVTTKRSAGWYGPALVTDRNGGELNVGPALSADGRRLVFLSSKDLFSIEMFVSDVASGRVERKIVKSTGDPHFDSLQFINSAGSWDPAGKRFAFGAVRKGKAILSIVDVDHGRLERELPFPQVGEIFDPAWSPDGKRIAFAALAGGLLDLFVYDLPTKALKRVTDDGFAELGPAWSPDGKTLAFATDRYTTRLADLAAGDFGLALWDAQSGEISSLPSFAGAKNINPQWSADGKSLFFISDHNGISNVYRLQMDEKSILQVTDLLTGASGITSLSPALSVAGGRLAYSVYEGEMHSIFAMEDPSTLAGFTPATETTHAAALPPLVRKRAEVAELNDNRTLGLPEKHFASADYKPKMSLDYVGQPTLSVGTSRMGTYVGGGVSFLLSDMLGNQNFAAALQIDGTFDDFGGVVAYQNRRHRWDWGAAIQQVPYLTGGYAIDTSVRNGQPVIVEKVQLNRQIERSASLFTSYPLSRAQRFELSGAVRNVSYKSELRTQFFDYGSGQAIAQEKQKLPAPSGLSLAEGGAALVYDSSVFGVASPIRGRRYRLEVSPTVGTVSYTGVLADLRQYVMPVRPYTIAARVIHYGRYGSGSEDPRFYPLFLGYPELVRGYDFYSFSAAECGAAPGQSCPVFDQLVGSRVLIGNIELRFPPFGAFGGRRFYGPLPVELIAFADTGVAWTKAEKAAFLKGGTRKRVSSVGGGARVNLFGFAVMEIDFVRPLDRPGRGWIWQFNFRPGF